MIRIPNNVDSKYRFVILSALRARQLQGGSMPLIKDASQKSTQIARKELEQELVKFNIPDPKLKQKAREEAAAAMAAAAEE